MAGVNDDTPTSSRPKDDTPRETPSAKGSDARMRISVPPAVGGDAEPANGVGDEGAATPPSGRVAAGDAAKRVRHDDAGEWRAPRPSDRPLVKASSEATTVSERNPRFAPGLDELASPLGPPSSGAHVTFAFSTAKVHTFEAKGPLGFLLMLVVLLAIGVILLLVFVLAVGVGVALLVGVAAAAALGVGAVQVGKVLGRSKSRELDDPTKKP